MTFYALRKKKLREILREKKQRHGNEFIYVRNSAEMRETEGKACTLTFLFMLLYLETEHEKMAANKNSCNLRNIWGASFCKA